MNNSPRGFAGLRQRMSRTEPKHANPEHGGTEPAAAIPAPTPTDSGELPVPLRPDDMRGGDHIDLRVSAEPQEHLFAYQPGAPLPARRRAAKPQTPAEGLPEAAVVPPVTGAGAIIASATVISPVSGTYLVSAEPIEQAQREAAAAMAAGRGPAGSSMSGAPGASPNYGEAQQAAANYRHEERRRVARAQQQQQQQQQPPARRPAGPPPYDPRRYTPDGQPLHSGYDGTGYGTPPTGTPEQTRPTAPRNVPALPISPNTEPLDLRQLQGIRPVRRPEPDPTLRRRTDQSADWPPASPAEREPESLLVSRPHQPAVSPAGRPLGPGPGDRPGTSLQLRSPKDAYMTNIDIVLKEAMQIDGAVGVALVDYTSGMTLGQAGGGTLNLEVAAAGNTEVVRAKLRTMEALGLREGIEDILITLDTQYHLIRLITDQTGIGLFLYLALDKHRSNLALARRKLANLERTIEI